MTGSTGFATQVTVRSVDTSAALPAQPTSRFEPIPELEPARQTATAVTVVTAPAKRGVLGAWFASKPKAPDDPVLPDASRAWNNAIKLPDQVRTLTGMLPHNAQLLAAAPTAWEELLTPYVLVRATTIAVMASAKVQLDAALTAGVQAALAMPSRELYQRTVAKIRAADAECEALVPTIRARHGEALAAQHKVTQVAEEAKAAERSLRESVRDLDPKVRAGLIEHIRTLGDGGYHFARAAYQDPAAPGGDMTLIAPEGVIPTLALHGSLVFGKKHPNADWKVIPHGNQRPVNSLAELIELAEGLMGRIARD